MDFDIVTTFLNKPYPFYFSFKRNFKLACIVGVVIVALNFSFSNNVLYARYFSFSIISISFFFGIITFLSVQIVLFEKWYIKKKQETWRIKNELKVLFTLHVVIGILNYSLLLLIANESILFFSFIFFFSVLASTVIIGMVPTFLIIWIDYTLKLKHNLKEVEKHNIQLKAAMVNANNDSLEDTDDLIVLGTTRANEVCFRLQDLLFIKSDGNYVDVYVNNNRIVEKKVSRISMHKIEEEFSKYETIVRTHRSYFVNIQSIKTTQGNARNYQLLFHNTEMIVPVSRNRFKIFNEALKNNLTFHNK